MTKKKIPVGFELKEISETEVSNAHLALCKSDIPQNDKVLLDSIVSYFVVNIFPGQSDE